MAKGLVVVESPTKARTIGRILGRDYTVRASLGHVRDLPMGRFGVAVNDGFAPEYVVPREKRAVVAEIKGLADSSPAVFLATDPDREGEAISWHLVQAASIDPSRVQRVVFHEITEGAVRAAFRHPRAIDMDLVDAQQARRVLDRLVGYSLSPLISRKIRWWGLSAGRVQSAALRMVVEREGEIEAFTPREHWSVEATLRPEGGRALQAADTFVAQVVAPLGQRQRLDIRDAASARSVADHLERASYAVAGVQVKGAAQRPAPPFITSTLQQEAWRKLRLGARRTMSIAQQLYEGVSLGDQGDVGLITYMRTDSTRVAATAVQEAREYAGKAFGPAYVPPQARHYSSRVKGAQEAHEAIRPTSVLRTPDSLRPHLAPAQLRVYDLVWRRFLASQMADALVDRTTVEVHATGPAAGQGYLLRASGEALRFAGFRALYLEGRDEPAADEGKALPSLEKGDGLRCLGVEPKQHFTQPPPRYTEASLVRALEEKGIGRPSTYAAIASTIQERGYVRQDRGRLQPTPLGRVVSGLLAGHFSQVVDLDFTARMEQELDNIARGERPWQAVLGEFYGPFSRDLAEASERMPRVDIPSGETCELCGRPMVVKKNRWGKTFLSCTGFPECRGARPMQTRTGVPCPECGAELVERQSSRGRRGAFYGCSSYPTCAFAVNRRPLPEPCPECGGLLVSAGRESTRCTRCKYRGRLEGEPAEPAPVGA